VKPMLEKGPGPKNDAYYSSDGHLYCHRRPSLVMGLTLSTVVGSQRLVSAMISMTNHPTLGGQGLGGFIGVQSG